MERCVCCDRPLALVAQHGAWCDTCIRGLQTDAALLRDTGDVRGVVEWLTLHGCLTLSRFVIGVLPFDDTPTS